MRAGAPICAALCVTFLVPACAARRTPSAGLAFPYGPGVEINRKRLNEPSGIAFHSGRKTLFAVGDEGDVCEMTTEGEVLRMRHYGDGGKEDFEGVAVHPGTGLLYVVAEGKDTVVEIDPESLDIIREFPLDRACEGRRLIAPGGQGIEGIAFVPDSSGETFYITNQAFDLRNEDDPSIIMKVRVPLHSSGEPPPAAVIEDYFSPDMIDISDIWYNPASDTLVAISDTENVIFEVTREGELLDAGPLPGRDQEGITMDGDGNLYIAQDSGEIIKYPRQGSDFDIRH